MGNKDGIPEAIADFGKNKVIYFNEGKDAFSFALGNEIALMLEKISRKCFILNCDAKLFEECKEQIKMGLTTEEIIKFWINKSKEYEISDWSADFDLLKEKK